MASDALLRALCDEPSIRPLPIDAVRILTTVDAPPRLAAHLRAVHEVAAQLVEWIGYRFPAVPIDGDLVRIGAALHDIGKVVHPAELSGPGSSHEAAGYRLLLEHGLPADVALIARDHADWHRPDASLEALLVSLADKVWKDKRDAGLEDVVVDRFAAATQTPRWAVFADLDEVLTAIGSHAVSRLAFQNRHAVDRVAAPEEA